MKNKIAFGLLLFCQIVSFSLCGQQKASYWHINDFGIHFYGEQLQVNQDNSVRFGLGVGSICDDNGKLLFYSDGQHVWNKNHELMPNGDTLNIANGTESLVVPLPGSASVYYLFTAGQRNYQDSSGVYYSVIDMNLNNGLGDVTTKGKKILNNTSCKLSATFHANGTDVWVMAQRWESNHYVSFLVTKDGISESYVESEGGKTGGYGFEEAQLKFSTDGKMVVSCYDTFSNPGFDLFHFDAATGKLSDPLSFDLSPSYYHCGGAEFSPDATVLYILDSDDVYQYDISAYNYEAINRSRFNALTNLHNIPEQLQLAINGKIYFGKGGGYASGASYLGAINDPNQLGIKCDVTEDGLFLNGGLSTLGRMPNFIQNYFFKANFVYDNNCQASPIKFKVTNTYRLESVRWDFGDGTYSSELNPVHEYSSDGSYEVQLLAYYPEKTDTIVRTIKINPFTLIDLGIDTTLCYGDKLLADIGFQSYLWNDGDTVRYNTLAHDGWYKVVVGNQFGCLSSDSVYVTVTDLPDINLPDTVFIGYQDSVLLDAGEFKSYEWSTGDTTKFIYAKSAGWYSLLADNNTGCKAAKSVLVMTNPVSDEETTSDWKVVNPKPTYLTGQDICFLNEKKGFLINNQELYRTNDSGKNWDKVMVLSGGNCIGFKNSIGYIIGAYGAVYKSTYGGDGWNKLDTGFTDNLTSLSLISEDTIRITSGNNKLFLSDDGGRTWKTRSITGGVVVDSYFTSGDVGHAVCNQGTILKTKNGGESWYVTAGTNTSPSNYFRVVFANEKLGFATRQHTEVFRTTDGGETWSNIKSLDAIYDIQFINDSTGFFCGEHGICYKTTDRGNTWTWISSSNRIWAYDLLGIYFVNENEGYATGVRGRILKTTDGGKTWEYYAVNYNDISQLEYTTNDTAYTLIGNELFRLTDIDSGLVSIGAPVPGFKTAQFDFIDKNIGYTISGGYVGTSSNVDHVYKTIDGGMNWVKLNDVYVIPEIYCMEFVNENLGFVSGGYNEPQVKKTTDGGKNWTKVLSVRFGQMQFLDDKIGFARNTGYLQNRLYKTTNGGETWSVVFEIDEDIQSFCFIDSLTGYFVGDNALIYKTVDGGKNWEKLSIPYEYYVFVHFISKNVGYILDEEGHLYLTYNGGRSWELWTYVPGLNSIAINGSEIYAYGTFGKILQNKIEVEPVDLHVNPVDSVTNVEAYLSGIVASNGASINAVTFEYAKDYSFTQKIPVTTSIATDSAGVVSTIVEGLNSQTTYYYRLACNQNGKQYYSNVESFVTMPDYEITLNWVSNYTSVSALINGQVVARDTAITDIRVQYSKDYDFSHIEEVVIVPSVIGMGESPNVGAEISSLSPQTRYYVRLKANHRGTDIYSPTITFTTPADFVFNLYSSYLNEGKLDLSFYMIPYRAGMTNIVLEYGATQAYESQYVLAPNSLEQGIGSYYTCQISGLDINALYFFRVRFDMDGVTYYTQGNLVSQGRELDISITSAQMLDDSSVLVKALVNTYGKYVHNITLKYGTGGVMSDSVFTSPSYVSGSKTVEMEFIVNGVKSNTEYTFQINGIYNNNSMFSKAYVQTLYATATVPELSKFSDVIVYPTPAKKTISVKSDLHIERLELLNTEGVLIRTSNNEKMNLSDLPEAMYLLKVYIGDDIVTRKVVKSAATVP